MLEGGISLLQLARYLGHSAIKNTIRYLHVTEISEKKGRDALDTLADDHEPRSPDHQEPRKPEDQEPRSPDEPTPDA